jgi:hypothetical protein
MHVASSCSSVSLLLSASALKLDPNPSHRPVVCMYMCVFMRIDMCVNMYVDTYEYMYVDTYEYMYVDTYEYMYVDTYEYMYVDMYAALCQCTEGRH